MLVKIKAEPGTLSLVLNEVLTNVERRNATFMKGHVWFDTSRAIGEILEALASRSITYENIAEISFRNPEMRGRLGVSDAEPQVRYDAVLNLDGFRLIGETTIAYSLAFGMSWHKAQSLLDPDLTNPIMSEIVL